MDRAAWDGEAAIRGILLPGEMLIWFGRPARPDHGGSFGFTEAGLLVFAGIVAMLAYARLTDDQPLGLADLGKGAVLLLLIAYFAAPFLMSRPRRLWRRRIAYAVTSQRALILEAAARGDSVTSFGPAQIAFVVERDRGDGLHDVCFREGPALHHAGVFNSIGFLGILDAPGASQALTALRSARVHLRGIA